MPFPIQTPEPTRELVRLLKLVGRYQPELEDNVIPVVPLTLNDGFTRTVTISVNPAAGNTAYNDLSIATLLASQSPFDQLMLDRNWTIADVDVYLLRASGAGLSADIANLTEVYCGYLAQTGAIPQVLKYWAVAQAISTGMTAADTNEQLVDDADFTTFPPYPLHMDPPSEAHVYTAASAGGGGAATGKVIWTFRVQLKGLPFHP